MSLYSLYPSSSSLAEISELSDKHAEILANLTLDRLKEAVDNHASYNSSHEAYAVIKEEVDEFWAEVIKKTAERDKVLMRDELLDVAAACWRAILDLELLP